MVVRLLCKESVAGSTPAKGSKAFFDVLKIVATTEKYSVTPICTTKKYSTVSKMEIVAIGT